MQIELVACILLAVFCIVSALTLTWEMACAVTESRILSERRHAIEDELLNSKLIILKREIERQNKRMRAADEKK